MLHFTMCPRSSDPFYKVTYYIKWVTTSWIDSNVYMQEQHQGSTKKWE